MSANRLPLKHRLFGNASIKIMSLIIGYGIWSSISNSHTKDVWVTVPLCFYGSLGDNAGIINAPESISVHLSGKRATLRSIDFENCALHLNADALHVGTNALCVESAHLFLPNNIHVLDYTPAPLIITVSNSAPSLPSEASHAENNQSIC